MRTPTIHLNGTSRERLVEGYSVAIDKLYEAWAALREVHPHGRDYYPQGEGALQEAMREHEARIERVKSVIGEVTKVQEAIREAP